MVLELVGCYRRMLPKLVYDEDRKRFKFTEESEMEKEMEESKLGAWMFLFIDLIFVAVVSKCALIMENCAISPHSILFCCTILAVMFSTRLYIDDYCNRFYVNDLFHRIIYFGYAAAMFIFGIFVFVKDTEGGHSDEECQANIQGYGFMIAFVFSRLCIAGMYYSVIRADTTVAASEQCYFIVFQSIVSATFSATFAILSVQIDLFPPSFRMNTYIGCVFFEIICDGIHHYCAGNKRHLMSKSGWWWKYLIATEIYPIDTEMYVERMGAFIMIILGEVMITTLVKYNTFCGTSTETMLFSMVSCVVIFIYGLIYFDSTRPIEAHSKDGYRAEEDASANLTSTNPLTAGAIEPQHHNDFENDAGHDKLAKPRRTCGKAMNEEELRAAYSDNMPRLSEMTRESIIGIHGRQSISSGNYGSGSVRMSALWRDEKIEFLETSHNAVKNALLEHIRENHTHSHALTHSYLTSFLFTWMHLIIALCMFFTTAAIAIIAHEGPADDHCIGGIYNKECICILPAATPTVRLRRYLSTESSDTGEHLNFYHTPIMTSRMLLATSICVSLVLLAVLSILHGGFSQLSVWKSKEQKVFLIKLFGAGIQFIVPIFGQNIKNGSTVCFSHVILLLFSLIPDIRFIKEEEIQSKLESQRRDISSAQRSSSKSQRGMGHQMKSVNSVLNDHVGSLLELQNRVTEKSVNLDRNSEENKTALKSVSSPITRSTEIQTPPPVPKHVDVDIDIDIVPPPVPFLKAPVQTPPPVPKHVDVDIDIDIVPPPVPFLKAPVQTPPPVPSLPPQGEEEEP